MGDDGLWVDARDWGPIVRELDEKLAWLDIPARAGADESFAASWLALTYQLANVFTQAEVIEAAAHRACMDTVDEDFWYLTERLRELLMHAGHIVQLAPRLLTILASRIEGRVLLTEAPDPTDALVACALNMKRRSPDDEGVGGDRAGSGDSMQACELAASAVVGRMQELLAKPDPHALADVVMAVAEMVCSATSLLWELRDWDFRLGGAR